MWRELKLITFINFLNMTNQVNSSSMSKTSNIAWQASCKLGMKAALIIVTKLLLYGNAQGTEKHSSAWLKHDKTGKSIAVDSTLEKDCILYQNTL